MKLTWLNEQQLHDHDDALPELLNNLSIYARRRTIECNEERKKIFQLEKFSRFNRIVVPAHRGLDVASVRILSFSIENLLIQVDVIVVDGIVECDGDHLWHIFRWQITGNGCAVFRTKAIRKHTDRWIAWWSTIWIVVDVCWAQEKAHTNVNLWFFGELWPREATGSEKLTAWILIGTICTVFFAVAEETTFDTIAVTACQKPILTQWLIGDKQWLHFTFLVLQLAVLDSFLPVACLLFNIEIETSRTTDRLQSLEARERERERKFSVMKLLT